MILRPYQLPLVEAAQDAIDRRQSLVVVAPTGSGKTVCFASLTAQCVSNGRTVMILAHRQELLDQISATLDLFHVEHARISPDYPWKRKCPVQVASVMSLINRLAYYQHPDVLIVDECHHATGPSYGRILDAYSHAARIGFTATPERLDGKGLIGQFGEMFVGPQTRELMDLGALCDYRLFAPHVTYTEGLHKRMGDYDQKELAEATDTATITGNAVEHYAKITPGKRAIVFCVRIDHAKHVADRFKDAGFAAASIDGTMGNVERADTLRRFASRERPILTSCNLINEGFDCPGIEVAILLRPTQSLALNLQQVGRALRPFPGKGPAIILDHAGNSSRHGYPDDERTWTLEGRTKRSKGESGEAAVAVRTCPVCFLAVRMGVLACSYCGHVFVVAGHEVKEMDGELVEVDMLAARRDAKREQAKAERLEDLQALGRLRGYKPGWAWNVWKAREGRYARG